MSIPDQLRTIRDHLRSGRYGQREVWERQLEEAAAELERLRVFIQGCSACREEWERIARAALEPKP